MIRHPPSSPLFPYTTLSGSRRIQVAPGDNVAIVVNSLGLPAGTVFPDGLVLNHFVPQGHKVALADIADGGDVIRYNEVIGTDRKSTRLNSSHGYISYAVFCL